MQVRGSIVLPFILGVLLAACLIWPQSASAQLNSINIMSVDPTSGSFVPSGQALPVTVKVGMSIGQSGSLVVAFAPAGGSIAQAFSCQRTYVNAGGGISTVVNSTVTIPSGNAATSQAYTIWAQFRFGDTAQGSTCPLNSWGGGQIQTSTPYSLSWTGTPGGGSPTPSPTPSPPPSPSTITSIFFTIASGIFIEGSTTAIIGTNVTVDAGRAGNLYVFNTATPNQCVKHRISSPGTVTRSGSTVIAPPSRPGSLTYTIQAIFYPGEPETPSNCPIQSSATAVSRTAPFTINWTTRNDWRIVDAQVSQVIQDTNASGQWGDGQVRGTVQLSAGRETVLRVFVENGDSPDSDADVTARITIYRNGSVIKEDTVTQRINVGDGGVVTNEGKRKTTSGSLTYRLPVRVDEGTDEVVVQLNPSEVVWERDYGNNRLPRDMSRKIKLPYNDLGTLDIAWVNINGIVTDSAGVQQPYAGTRDKETAGATASLLRQTFPLNPARVNVHAWNGAFTWNKSLTTSQDASDLLLKLQTELALSNRRNQVYGFYHAKHTDALNLYGRSFPNWPQDRIYGQGVAAIGQEDLSHTFVHEIGHNLDLRHPHDPASGWPVGSGRVASIGEYGTLINGSTITIQDKTKPDIMSSGDHPDAWISPLSYNRAYHTFDNLSLHANAVATTDINGDYIIISGVISSTAGTLYPAYRVPAVTSAVVGTDGDYAVRFLDISGAVLLEHRFAPDFENTDGDGTVSPFFASLPYPSGATTIELVNGTTVYDTMQVSAHAPVVRLTSPIGGESWSTQPVTITWQASDADGNTLTYAVLYSKDGGNTWLALNSDLHETSITLDPQLIAGSSSAIIRVLATDGIHTSSDQNDLPFVVATKGPEATIIGPGDGTSYRHGDGVVFYGQGYDMEDGILDSSVLRWISDRDGPLGTGSTFQTYGLSIGVHTITLEVTDSEGKTSRDSILIVIHDRSQTDLTPPTTTISITGTSGKNGWYVSPVQITLTATDDRSGVKLTQYRVNGGAWITYQGPFTFAAEGTSIFEYRSIDNVGNIEQIRRTEIKIDTRRPVVTITLPKPQYTRIEPFTATWSVVDPMPGSGIESTLATLGNQRVTNGQVIDLFWYDLGTYTLVVTGTDYAGWSTTNQASFELIATIESLIGTVDRLCEMGDIDNRGVCTALSQKLVKAKEKRDTGQAQVAVNMLHAFIHQVEAQDGQHISHRAKRILVMDARYVIEQLNSTRRKS